MPVLLIAASSISFFSFNALSRVGGFSFGAGVKLAGFSDFCSSPKSTFHLPVSESKAMHRPFLPLSSLALARPWILTTAPGCMPGIFGQVVFSPKGRLSSFSSFSHSFLRTSGFSRRYSPLVVIHCLSISKDTSMLASLMAFCSPLTSSTVQRPDSASFLISLQYWPLREAAAALCSPWIRAARLATMSWACWFSYSFRILIVGFISSMPPLSRILLWILLMTSSLSL
mmetsp:Transcript_71319/g.220422  ORF Transcript_71319/g.220422 Transcript_71319/m.220422 type:complete len:228 (-) Transcript_71319:266-949(-)